MTTTPPDERLAEQSIESGQPFEITLTSDGRDLRVWMEMECEGCSLPVTGKIAVLADGKVVDQNEVSAGDSRDRAWGGTHRRLTEHPVFDADAQPTGTPVTVKGVLKIGPPRTGISNEPVENAPPPVVKTFLLYVTP